MQVNPSCLHVSPRASQLPLAELYTDGSGKAEPVEAPIYSTSFSSPALPATGPPGPLPLHPPETFTSTTHTLWPAWLATVHWYSPSSLWERCINTSSPWLMPETEGASESYGEAEGPGL